MKIDLTNKSIIVQGFGNNGIPELIIQIMVAPKTERKTIGQHQIIMRKKQWEAISQVFQSGNNDFTTCGDEETEPIGIV
jgi:hypothetical protein